MLKLVDVSLTMLSQDPGSVSLGPLMLKSCFPVELSAADISCVVN